MASLWLPSKEQKKVVFVKCLGAGVVTFMAYGFNRIFVLVLLSCFIAAPIAWYYLHNWLSNYDYRIEIKWQVFVMAGIAALIITLLTVSFQAIKAALSNPIKSLRTE
jgi:ABC-type antimicrobial peptide transport system permease subunit